MEIRIGDAERETATTRLGDHFAAGRLDHEEYSERLDAVWTARTRADLDQIFLDLPLVPVRAPAVRPVKPSKSRRGGALRAAAAIVAVVLAVLVMQEAGKFALALVAVWFVFLRPRRDRRPPRSRRVHSQLGPPRYLAP